MPVETSRVVSRRRLRPTGSSGGTGSVYVDLKVTDQISFKDIQRRGQEITWIIDNGPESARGVHTVNVTGSDGSSIIQVERVDSLPVKDNRSRGQEMIWYFDNSQEPPIHSDTYEKKVYAKNADSTLNTGTWVKVQRFRSLPFRDPRQRGQEALFQFQTPDLEDEQWDYDYTNAPLVTQHDGTDINPPWRIDPFQNIVDVSWGEGNLLVLYSGNKAAIISTASLTGASANVVVNRTLTTSNWGADRMKVCQLKLAAGQESVVLAPFSVAANVLDNKAKFHLFRTGRSDRSLSEFVETSDVTTKVPIFNGDGTTIYTPHDKFTLGSTISLVESVSAYDEVYTTTISPTGDRFTLGVETINAGAQGFSIFDWNDLRENAADYNLTPTQTTAADAYFATYPGQIQMYGYVGGGDSSSLDIQSALYSAGATTSMDINLKIGVFTQTGGVDSVAVSDVNFHGVWTDEVPGPGGSPRTWEGSYRWWDSPGLGGIIPFPFSKGTTQGQSYFVKTQSNVDTIEVPYGAAITNDRASTGYDTADEIFEGWLHLSNGTHVLQAFKAKNDIYAYYDGVNVIDKITAALSVSATDIQAMVLDVPSSVVEGLL